MFLLNYVLPRKAGFCKQLPPAFRFHQKDTTNIHSVFAGKYIVDYVGRHV